MTENLAHPQFSKGLSGYKVEEVDSYIDKVLDTIKDLKDQNEVLEEKIGVLAESLQKYREDEDSLREALLGAQKMGDSIVKNANNKAEITMREASVKAAHIVEEARKKVEDEKDEQEAGRILDNLLARQDEALQLAAAVQTQLAQAETAAQDVRRSEDDVADVRNRMERLREEQRALNGPAREVLESQTTALRQLRALSSTLATEQERLAELEGRLISETPARSIKNLPLLLLGAALFLAGAGTLLAAWRLGVTSLPLTQGLEMPVNLWSGYLILFCGVGFLAAGLPHDGPERRRRKNEFAHLQSRRDACAAHVAELKEQARADAIANGIRKENPNANIVYIKGDQFTNELIAAIQNGKNIEFRSKYREADLFLIDDVQFIAGKESTQEEFFHTFNKLYEEHKQIVMTSDRKPSDMLTLEDRLKTRFEWGLLADIQPPDYETRMAILKNKAKNLGLNLSDDVCNYIAINVTNNVRQIEGTVKKILAYRDLNNMPLDLPNISRAIDDMFKSEGNALPTPSLIISQVCKFYSIDEVLLRGTQKNKGTAEARQIAMYLIRKLTNLSLPDIGKEFARDHSTVLYAIRKVEVALKNGDTTMQNNIRDITANINSCL